MAAAALPRRSLGGARCFQIGERSSKDESGSNTMGLGSIVPWLLLYVYYMYECCMLYSVCAVLYICADVSDGRGLRE